LLIKLYPLRVGDPDRILLLPGGRAAFVEMKKDGKKPSKIQRVMHAELSAMGFEVWVIRSKTEMLAKLALLS
jgi:hypothetical protein